ncbi:MAG: Cyanoglobin; Hemoglobin-like protein HbN, partial [uncultured Lysobacter sp.]
ELLPFRARCRAVARLSLQCRRADECTRTGRCARTCRRAARPDRTESRARASRAQGRVPGLRWRSRPHRADGRLHGDHARRPAHAPVLREHRPAAREAPARRAVLRDPRRRLHLYRPRHAVLARGPADRPRRLQRAGGGPAGRDEPPRRAVPVAEQAARDPCADAPADDQPL